MAFSLQTGEWLRTIGTPRGDGPHEFSWGRKGIAIAPGGGLYVSGNLRVIEYSAEGTPVNSWRPEAPTLQRVCNLSGAPAVPTQGGVVRRGTEGMSERVGPVEAQGRRVGGNDIEGVYRRLRSARIACHGSVAFVSMPFGAAGPDSLFVYELNGQHGRLTVPVEDADSDAFRPLIPTEAVHRFRFISSTDSDAKCPSIPTHFVHRLRRRCGQPGKSGRGIRAGGEGYWMT